MAMQHSAAVRNAKISAMVTAIGNSPKLQIWSGPKPADCATAPTGSKLAELTLPATWMGAPASGAAALAGSWTGTASAGGTASFYRIVDSTGANCHEQGDLATSGGDLTIAAGLTIANGQTVTVSSRTYTEGNA